jgi:hypothetical protein
MLKTNFKSIVLPLAVIGLCVSILTSAIQVPNQRPVQMPVINLERLQVSPWIEVQGVSLRTDAIVGFQAHETREDNSVILTDGGWEFEVPVTYGRLKERLGQ